MLGKRGRLSAESGLIRSGSGGLPFVLVFRRSPIGCVIVLVMLLRVSLLILLGVLCYNVCLNTTWGFASCSSLKNSGVLISSRIPSIFHPGPINRQLIQPSADRVSGKNPLPARPFPASPAPIRPFPYFISPGYQIADLAISSITSIN